jgi:hypothetical protein
MPAGLGMDATHRRAQHAGSRRMARAVVRRCLADASWRAELLALCRLPPLAAQDDSSVERCFREVDWQCAA